VIGKHAHDGVTTPTAELAQRGTVFVGQTAPRALSFLGCLPDKYCSALGKFGSRSCNNPLLRAFHHHHVSASEANHFAHIVSGRQTVKPDTYAQLMCSPCLIRFPVLPYLKLEYVCPHRLFIAHTTQGLLYVTTASRKSAPYPAKPDSRCIGHKRT